MKDIEKELLVLKKGDEEITEDLSKLLDELNISEEDKEAVLRGKQHYLKRVERKSQVNIESLAVQEPR